MTYPTITVIIPRKADGSAEEAVQAVLHSDYPQHLLEIIEVIGESPSKQRNMAAESAHGEIVYFLDNDSIVTPTLFSRVAKYYDGAQGAGNLPLPAHKRENLNADAPDEQTRLAGIGGPNLTPTTDGFLQKTFGYALASPFGHFQMCARYKPAGRMRYTGEKELILCNLSVHRDVFLQEHGFDESMYPNEENEFINRLVEKGYRFLYDPDAYVYRSRRNRFLAFIRQLFHYGGGRADQIMVEGFSLKSLLFFLPLGLLCYTVLLAVLSIGKYAAWWHYPPFILYWTLAFLSALQYAVQERNPLLVGILPLWYFVMHSSYGVGLLWGFLNAWVPIEVTSDDSSPPVEIVVRKALHT
jgi:succinoglycan biosynthesis protein ExoA